MTEKIPHAEFFIGLRLFKKEYPVTVQEIMELYKEDRPRFVEETEEACREFAERFIGLLEPLERSAKECDTIGCTAWKNKEQICELVLEYTNEDLTRESMESIRFQAMDKSSFHHYDALGKIVQEIEEQEPTHMLDKLRSYGNFTEEFAAALFGNMFNTQYAARTLNDMIYLTDMRTYGSYKHRGKRREYKDFKVTDYITRPEFYVSHLSTVTQTYSEMFMNLSKAELEKRKLRLSARDGPHTQETRHIARQASITLEMAYDIRKHYTKGSRGQTGLEIVYESGTIEDFYEKHITMPHTIENRDKEMSRVRFMMEQSIDMMKMMKELREKNEDTNRFRG